MSSKHVSGQILSIQKCLSSSPRAHFARRTILRDIFRNNWLKGNKKSLFTMENTANRLWVSHKIKCDRDAREILGVEGKTTQPAQWIPQHQEDAWSSKASETLSHSSWLTSLKKMIKCLNQLPQNLEKMLQHMTSPTWKISYLKRWQWFWQHVY